MADPHVVETPGPVKHQPGPQSQGNNSQQRRGCLAVACPHVAHAAPRPILNHFIDAAQSNGLSNLTSYSRPQEELKGGFAIVGGMMKGGKGAPNGVIRCVIRSLTTTTTG